MRFTPMLFISAASAFAGFGAGVFLLSGSNPPPSPLARWFISSVCSLAFLFGLLEVVEEWVPRR